MEKATGVVYLVGAGPGDPGLVTVRGLEILRKADVVIVTDGVRSYDPATRAASLDAFFPRMARYLRSRAAEAGVVRT